MPKNLRLESIRHHLLSALEEAGAGRTGRERDLWEQVSRSLQVSQDEQRQIIACWSEPRVGSVTIDRTAFKLYQRGDLPVSISRSDPSTANADAARRVVTEIGRSIELDVSGGDDRLRREEEFHDEWAAGVDPADVTVAASFEACTAPENRFIVSLLGDIEGKEVLDLGCGLGEAAVYFAGLGARVTACDLSRGMLDTVEALARRHGAHVRVHQAPADDTGLSGGSFDVVYAANLLHHVDLDTALGEIQRLLKPGGTFVSWDPLAHNPLINVYRRMASSVRTSDEHPLRMGDLELFRQRFEGVGYRCFWLWTLLIFVRFYVWERVHPSKERYWKKILSESERLAPLYGPLEALDRVTLRVVPWLGRYCWNVVVWGRKRRTA